jgi:peptide deformylase
MELVYYPDPRLRDVSKKISTIDQEILDAIPQMFEIMYKARGIGLAGPQAGLGRRIVVANLSADPKNKDDEQVFINPEILGRSGKLLEEEGCLSLPGMAAQVPRAEKVLVRYKDLSGRTDRARSRAARIAPLPARDRPPRRHPHRRQADARRPQAVGAAHQGARGGLQGTGSPAAGVLLRPTKKSPSRWKSCRASSRSPDPRLRSPIVTWGVFDGVHRGHRRVIEHVLSWAAPKASRRPSPRSTAPRGGPAGRKVPLVTPLGERLG